MPSVFAFMLAAMCISASAGASIVVFTTLAGATSGGQNVDARATFTTGDGQITVLLENLYADPTSVGQCLSGLYFTVGEEPASVTLADSSGVERTVLENKTYQDAPGVVATGWVLSAVGAQLHLSRLDAPGKKTHTIIGPPDAANLYSSANSSIAKSSSPHIPFLAQEATFVIDAPGVTPATTVVAATFSFNTVAGYDVPGVPGEPVPEPAALSLLGVGGGLWLLRRRAKS